MKNYVAGAVNSVGYVAKGACKVGGFVLRHPIKTALYASLGLVLAACGKNPGLTSLSNFGHENEIARLVEMYSQGQLGQGYICKESGKTTAVVFDTDDNLDLDMDDGYRPISSREDLEGAISDMRTNFSSAFARISAKGIRGYPCGEGAECEPEMAGIIISPGRPSIRVTEGNPNLLRISDVSVQQASEGGGGSGGGGAGGGCFTPDTLIAYMTTDGGIAYKPMGQFNEGDMVLSYDFETNQAVQAPITKIYQRTADELVDVEGIQATPDHEFMTTEGFAPVGFASNLNMLGLGDIDGNPSTLEEIALTGRGFLLAEDVPVLDFDVGGDVGPDCYFVVGDDGLLRIVHNSGGGGGGGSGGGR